MLGTSGPPCSWAKGVLTALGQPCAGAGVAVGSHGGMRGSGCGHEWDTDSVCFSLVGRVLTASCGPTLLWHLAFRSVCAAHSGLPSHLCCLGMSPESRVIEQGGHLLQTRQIGFSCWEVSTEGWLGTA